MAVSKQRKQRGKKGAARKRAAKKTNVPEWASLSCKRSLATTVGPGFASNTLYSLMNTQLLDYPRAVSVAQAYQHYRIKSVRLTFKPQFDTYVAVAGGVSKPNLYYMIDKSGTIPTNATLESLKQMGARPHQLDEKNFSVTWSPSVLESVMYSSGGAGAASSSKYRISPWLATTADNVSPAPVVANAVDHLGLYWYMDQIVNPIGAQYTIEAEVQFEFKKPLITVLATGRNAIGAVVAPLNDSPDGIIGGGDGI